MCIGILIPLNLAKLHCIIIAISCIHASHDHADSFYRSGKCCIRYLL
jgi:hypothetical protein